MSALVILGSGFDIDLGLENSCEDFSKSRLCPVAGNELWSSFENTLRSEIISWYKNGMDRQKAEDLNRLWQLYVRNISFFFTEQSDKYKIDKNTCAYRFLKSIKRHSKSKIYSFNYTNPYEYVDIPQVMEITHLHGRHYRDTFNKDLMVMSQKLNIILGVDACIPEDGLNNPLIHPLVKKRHPKYKETDIVVELAKAENVIFYGFSMGRIDYSYFRDFFNTISNGSSRCRKLYYVTDNAEGFKYFLNTLKENNLNIDNIIKQIEVISIYTQKGFKNRDFRMMLRRL